MVVTQPVVGNITTGDLENMAMDLAFGKLPPVKKQKDKSLLCCCYCWAFVLIICTVLLVPVVFFYWTAINYCTTLYQWHCEMSMCFMSLFSAEVIERIGFLLACFINTFLKN